MNFNFQASAEEAIEFIRAYEKSSDNVSGHHGLSVSATNHSNGYSVDVAASDYRVFMELMANMHLEMPDKNVAPNSDDEEGASEVFGNQGQNDSEGDSEDDSEIPGEFQGAPASDEEDEEYEDEEEDEDEDDEEEEDEDDEDEEEPENGSDDSQVVKLKRPSFVQATGNKNISVVRG